MYSLAHALNLAVCEASYLYRSSRTFRVGGLRFVRLGRFQVSFCVCRVR
jgi:hypothetical protein